MLEWDRSNLAATMPPHRHPFPPAIANTEVHIIGKDPLIAGPYRDLPPDKKLIVGNILRTWLDWVISQPQFTPPEPVHTTWHLAIRRRKHKKTGT